MDIVNEDLESADMIFGQIDSPRGHWGVAFAGILNGYIKRYPTYFEIRNFFEIDLDFLIKNNKMLYIENALKSVDVLAEFNQEIYKYVARVMFENKYYQTSKDYLEKAADTFYRDPELHFLFAKYYKQFSQYEKALFYLQECLNYIPDYYPAIQLRQELESLLKKN